MLTFIALDIFICLCLIWAIGRIFMVSLKFLLGWGLAGFILMMIIFGIVVL